MKNSKLLILMSLIYLFPLNVLTSSTNKTQLNDLNVDEKLIILESLEVKDLFSIAKISPDFLFLAQNVFHRKHSKKVIKIFDSYLRANIGVRDNGEAIFIYNYNTILNVLKDFGHLILKLKIEYIHGHTIGTANMIEVSKLINFYCADTLVEFDIRNLYHDFFEPMSKPFKMIEKMSVRGKFHSLGSLTMTFDELFPVMRHLSVKYVEIVDTSSLHRTFLRLQHVDIFISRLNDSNLVRELDVEKMLRKNPQIRNLTLRHSSRKLFETINEYLPNLKQLQLERYYPSADTENTEQIIFEHIEIFKIIESSELLNSIRFKRLIEIHMGSLKEGTEFAEIVRRNPFLRKLVMEKGQMNNEDLEKLTAIDSNLSEIFLILSMEVRRESIINFVGSNNNLRTIEFTGNEPYSFETVAEVLKNQFGHKWNITESKFNLLLRRHI